MQQAQAPSGGARSRRWGWAALLVLDAAVLVLVVLPVWIMRPFAPQGAGALVVAYRVHRAAPVVVELALIAAVALAAWLARPAGPAGAAAAGGTRRTWWRRAGAAAALLPAVAAVWMSRQNVTERMFAPLPGPAFVRASDAASFVADRDLVLAVERGGDAAAYPIRQAAYHHVVQDLVGGTPVAVTY